jgi:hypothetical protein
MSIRVYRQNGGPADAIPLAAIQPNNSPVSGGTTTPRVCMVTDAGMAT